MGNRFGRGDIETAIDGVDVGGLGLEFTGVLLRMFDFLDAIDYDVGKLRHWRSVPKKVAPHLLE